MINITVDAVIFGGGVAGLWTLATLKQAGYSAALFETNTLGGMQTLKAQGIIHGGLKYALQGVLTREVRALTEMPERWMRCIRGESDLNLSELQILAKQHYMWAPGRLMSHVTGVFGNAALSSRLSKLMYEEYPAVFRCEGFHGAVYAMDEIVIDVPRLVHILTERHRDSIFSCDPIKADAWSLSSHDGINEVILTSQNCIMRMRAKHFIFTAGAANQDFIQNLIPNECLMQKRPLHMVVVRFPREYEFEDYKLYAHCVEFSSKPRITITTHRTIDGRVIWYLGGGVAETGVLRNKDQQISFAITELRTLFPWLDFSHADFSTFHIDRAEPAQQFGVKPDTSYVKACKNMLVAWPTKLALTPNLADEVLKHIKWHTPDMCVSQRPHQVELRQAEPALQEWSYPQIGQPEWETCFEHD